MKEECKPGHETYEISLESPLSRYGMKITARVSGRYVVPTMHHMLQCARQFNDEQNEMRESKLEKKSE